MLACFEAQDYPDRELVILADDGLYLNGLHSIVQRGDRWKLWATPERLPTLGSKRNAACRLISDDVSAVAVWDDDDIYLPWALSACVAALEQAPWCRPSLVLHAAEDGKLAQYKTWAGPESYYKLYHAAWAFRRELIEAYPYNLHVSNGEDQDLSIRLMNHGTKDADPCELGFRPYFLGGYGRDAAYIPGESAKLSWFRGDGYTKIGNEGKRTASDGKVILAPELPTFFNYHDPEILPNVHARRF